MYFTSGQDRAFERLMQEKPGFNHYDGGGANAPEDCGSCRFYRPDWKYQYCVYAECPYQPGKLTALAAVKFTVKGADDDMAVFRVEKNKGYTVMSNHHLRNKALSLKAKGLLSQMLSLPEDWDYTLKGLSLINRESIDAIRTAVWELERAGYIRREQGRFLRETGCEDIQGFYYSRPLPLEELEQVLSRRAVLTEGRRETAMILQAGRVNFVASAPAAIACYDGNQFTVLAANKASSAATAAAAALAASFAWSVIHALANVIGTSSVARRVPSPM